MSKKKWILIGVSVMIAAILVVCLVTKPNRINASQVESIAVWTHVASPGNQIVLDAVDAKQFIKLYNAAEYGGKATGEGGTPEYGVVVHYRSGAKLYVSDFNTMNHNFEVHYENGIVRGKAFYIDSEELNELVVGFAKEYRE